MFSADTRSKLLDQLVARARGDERIESAALMGSLAAGTGDAFSDIDLSFGVAATAELDEVVEDWTRHMHGAQRAVTLFDLESGGSTYRVFLRDDCLQVDLSFTPGGRVRKAGPRYEQLFGDCFDAEPAPLDAERQCGWAAHLAHAARVRIERGRFQQAYWCVAALHEQLVALTCADAGLAWQFARGADELPADVRATLDAGIAGSTEAVELDRALRACIELLLAYDGAGAQVIASVRSQLERFRDRPPGRVH
jgi:hypothetical protein